MPLVKQDRWAPSARPYAIARDTARSDGHSGFRVDAIWVGRKRGATTLTAGSLHLFTADNRRPATLDDALAAADMRYGGDWHHQYNGLHLLIEPGHPLTFTEAAALEETLAARRDALPAVPDGYDGWYYRQDTP